MTPQDIKIGNHYIVTKNENDYVIEQYVLLDNIYQNNGKTLYDYSYGFFRSHDGVCTFENIRKLTEEEQELEKSDRFKLPRQFYDVP